jgi:hypothetical protein
MHRLGFIFSYDTTPWPDAGLTLSDFRGTVTVQAIGAGGGPHLFGVIIPEAPLVIEPHREAFTSYASFYIDLEPARVNAIEGLRNGGDLAFVIELTASVTGQKARAPYAARGNVYFQVNQRTWIDALKAMHYGDFLLFEVPIPSHSAPEELKHAVATLAKAREHLLVGHYGDAVAACRKCLEGVTKALGESKGVTSAREVYRTSDAKAMTMEARYLFLREAATHVAHLAVHTDATGSTASFDRSDAICMLGVTAALLSQALAGQKSGNSDS